MPTEIFKINGITVANIKNYSEITFFGIATINGSNYETKDMAGIAHFLEHCFFRGTNHRTWKQINDEFAKLGSYYNAYTGNTEIFYHATCPQDNIEKLIELMMDMFFNSTIPIDEMEKERNIITEEKKMYEDDHQTAFSESMGEYMFDWQVGHDTIGTFDTINNISRDNIISYLNDKINLDNFIFICCGNINSDNLKKYIEKNIPHKHHYLKEGNWFNTFKMNKLWNDELTKCSDKVKFVFKRDNLTQSTLFMVMDALPSNHSLYYVEAIIHEAIGGGSYSKLYSRIREELGLCYSVGMNSLHMSYPNNRIANIYGHTSLENVDKFILESEKILRSIMEEGLDEDVFECAKMDYLSSVLRRTETSSGKAMYLVEKLLFRNTISIEEILQEIRKVKIKDCNDLVGEILDVPWHWAIMIPK